MAGHAAGHSTSSTDSGNGLPFVKRTNSWRLLGVLMALLVGTAEVSAQTTRKVYAGGTSAGGDSTYTNSQLQSAIDDAAPGDTILLQSAITYVDNFKLKAKTCPANDTTCYITIRTGVDASGNVLSTSLFPAANVRITPSYASVLAKLQTDTNNAPALETDDAPAVPNWWKLQWLEFIPNDWAGGALIEIGTNDAAEITSRSQVPSHFIIEQVYAHGDPVRGQFRCLSLHGNDITVKDSYCGDIKSLSEGQAIFWTTGNGLTVTNTYLEATGENFLAGGHGGAARQSTTVQASPAPTTTSATLTAVTELFVGQGVTFDVGGVEEPTEIVSCGTSTVGAACSSTAVTFSPALSGAPDVPGDVDYGVVPKNLTITKSHFTKNPAWQPSIVPTPQSVQASGQTTGGTLTAGTYFYRVVARQSASPGSTARSAASVEVSATVTSGTTGSATISWAAVTNATSYRVYGRNSGGQTQYWVVTAPTTSYTDTGSVGTAEAVPTSSGTRWLVKTNLEMKIGEDALIEGNVFDYAWHQAQTGYCVLFTPSNSSNTNDSTRLRDVTFRHNQVRHCGGGFQVTGRDSSGEPVHQTKRITIFNNTLEDVGPPWASGNRTFIFTGGPPQDITIEHNTMFHAGANAILYFDLHRNNVFNPVQNITFRNNMARKGSNGVIGNGSVTQGANAWNSHTTGTRPFQKNVIADASCSVYPEVGQNFCPSESQWQAEFIDYAGGNYRLKSTSPYKNAATDGTDIGANIDTIIGFTSIALSGDNTGGGTPPTPPQITTTSISSGSAGAPYTATLSCVGTGARTWSVTPTFSLPSGASLSSAGVLTWPTPTAGSYAFSLRCTDATTLSDDQAYTLTIEATPSEPQGDVRAPRYGWSEGGFWVRPEPPGLSDQPRVGDLWFDTTTGTLNYISATSPTFTTTPVTPGSSSPTYWITFLGDSQTASFTWSAMPALETDFDGTVANRRMFDLSGTSQARIYTRTVAASASGAKLKLQYNLDTSCVTCTTGWVDIATVTLGTTGAAYAGAWTPIPTAAKTTVYLRIAGVDGDGSASPAFTYIGVQIKP